MNGILPQLGLISIYAVLIYVLWKLDRHLHEKYEDDVTLKSDDGDDE